MEVASDTGMAPVTGEAKQAGSDVGGLIAAVESKMSELMGWHAQQVKQLETDKTVIQAKADKERQKLEGENKLLANRVEQVEQQRIKLVELTSKLRAEESAMSREWSEVHREREALQRQASELAEQRQRVDERAKQWLETTSQEISQPLKLADAQPTEGEDADRNAA